MGYMPGWLQNNSNVESQIADVLSHWHNASLPMHGAYQTVTCVVNGITLTIDLSAHNDPGHEMHVYMDVSITGSLQQLENQGYAPTVTQTGSGTQALNNFLKNI
jgi:hypothetical protein